MFSSSFGKSIDMIAFVAGGGEASGASMDFKSKTINKRKAPVQIITGPAALRDCQDISVVL